MLKAKFFELKIINMMSQDQIPALEGRQENHPQPSPQSGPLIKLVANKDGQSVCLPMLRGILSLWYLKTFLLPHSPPCISQENYSYRLRLCSWLQWGLLVPVDHMA